MVLFDGIVLVIVLSSSALGLWRGLTREMLSLVSWGMAAWVTLSVLPLVHPFFLKLISNPFWALISAVALLFLASLILLLFLSDGLVSWVQGSFLRGVDHVLGFAFGAARGLLLVFLFYWGFSFFLSNPQISQFSQDAVSATWIDRQVVGLKEDLQQRVIIQGLLARLKEKVGPLLEDPSWVAPEVSKYVPDQGDPSQPLQGTS